MVTTVKVPVMDAIMPPEKLRPLLAIARREPISVAVSITAGDEEPIILPHKTAGPKKAMAQLKAEAAKAKATLNPTMTRFGIASVDPDDDPATLKITINKEAPDKLRLKLTQLVKRFSFKAVVFSVDPGLENEQEDQDGQAEQKKPGETPGNPAALTAALIALVKRLPEAGARLPEAQAMAKRAGTGIKINDLAEAAKTLQALEALLDAAGAAQRAVPALDPAEAARLDSYDKARRFWLATVKSVDVELAKLTAAIKTAYDPEGLGDAVAAAFAAQARPVVARFDAGLATAIQAAIDADAAGRAGALKQARDAVATLQAGIAAAPMLGLLDACPITAVSIGQPLRNGLAVVARTLAPAAG